MTDVPRSGVPLPGTAACPRATAGLPGVGGRLLSIPEHFLVDEIPAYPPSGEGNHWFARVQKRELSSTQARAMLATAAGVQPRDIGMAGRKDWSAVTTQWFSLPSEPIEPEDERLTILESTPHGQKLRMGHLRGNRFTIRLTGVNPDAEARLPALLEVLAAGVPNYFGHQRFGRNNLDQAMAFLGNPRRRVKDPRFLASTAQSAVFNHWLGARLKAGLLHQALLGDVLRKADTGGLFDCESPEEDTPRVAAGEVDPTGPLPGPKMRPGVLADEAAALDAAGIDADRRKALARFAPGSRRVARLRPTELNLEVDGPDLVARFVLPKGSFATVVLGELVGREGPLRREDL